MLELGGAAGGAFSVMPVSKCVSVSVDVLRSLGVQLRGRIGLQWICYVVHGRQLVRSYGKTGEVDPSPWTKPWQDKFAAGHAAAIALGPELKKYWQRLGSRRRETLPWYHTFMSAWLLDQVDPESMRRQPKSKY